MLSVTRPGLGIIADLPPPPARATTRKRNYLPSLPSLDCPLCWDAFINWVWQHPVTAERLMRIVDDDPQWRAERPEAASGLSRVAKMEHRNAPVDLQQFYTATDLEPVIRLAQSTA